MIGGGAGGISVASQLLRTGKFKKNEITVIDPSDTHYYQPAFTMVGGGVLGTA